MGYDDPIIQEEQSMTTVYAILVTEDGLDTYLLGNCTKSFQRTQEIMAHRAEELIDELTAMDVEAGGEAGQYELRHSKDDLSIQITRLDGLDPTVMHPEPAIVATLRIQPSVLVD